MYVPQPTKASYWNSSLSGINFFRNTLISNQACKKRTAETTIITKSELITTSCCHTLFDAFFQLSSCDC